VVFLVAVLRGRRSSIGTDPGSVRPITGIVLAMEHHRYPAAEVDRLPAIAVRAVGSWPWADPAMVGWVKPWQRLRVPKADGGP
jgi:hypothetical protein